MPTTLIVLWKRGKNGLVFVFIIRQTTLVSYNISSKKVKQKKGNRKLSVTFCTSEGT